MSQAQIIRFDFGEISAHCSQIAKEVQECFTDGIVDIVLA